MHVQNHHGEVMSFRKMTKGVVLTQLLLATVCLHACGYGTFCQLNSLIPRTRCANTCAWHNMPVRVALPTSMPPHQELGLACTVDLAWLKPLVGPKWLT